MIFWDTSAIVKCYAALEADHARAKNLLLGSTGHAASVLLRPEATSALVRRSGSDRRLRDSLLELLAEHLRHFHIMAIDDHQIDVAVRLIRKHSLRGADGVHLAAAASLATAAGRRGFHFATADLPQAKAATAEGLRVIVLRS